MRRDPSVGQAALAFVVTALALNVGRLPGLVLSAWFRLAHSALTTP